jgi:ABC-type polysaccharide/polyol phosphate transport system ATPase subunit
MARAIETQGLSKRYRLGEFRRYETIREALAGLGRGRRVSGGAAREVWALRDVDLAVEEGEVVGVIGRNGAGKTTLLKLLARITEPTAGVARTRGRVSALLEVGTGFHPELTGRENVYLNGSVLGMSRREVGRRLDEIVAFAELERFLDTPLKRYSAGMELRLAFAVAAHLEPDVLFVDEVLAVGDVEFQKKCLGRMSELNRAGRTVLFVSHDLGAVHAFCSRAVWLNAGRIVEDGPADRTLDVYLKSIGRSLYENDSPVEAGAPVRLVSVAVTDEEGTVLQSAYRGDPLTIQLRFVVRKPIRGFDVAVYAHDRRGIRVLDEAWSDALGAQPSALDPGEYEARVTLPPVLAAGDYVVGVWIGSTTGSAYETFIELEALAVEVLPRPTDRKEWGERPRVLHLSPEWSVAARSVDSHVVRS